MIEGKYDIFICVAKDVPHSVEFYTEDGEMRGVHTTPLGKQRIEKVVCNEWSVEWECYAGTEGTELFRNLLIFSEHTDEVRGYAVGAAPYFRGFTPISGRKVR